MAELQRKKQKSVGTVCKDAIMTGISYMIPVIVGGGVITAIAKMMGGYNIGDTAAEMQTLAQVIFTIGNNLFAFAVPCLAAFIAYATDLMRHATNASIATLKENPQIDYMDLCIAVEDAMKDFIKSYIRVIGSSGRYSFEKHNGPELD